MKVIALRTPRLSSNSGTIYEVLDNALPHLEEGSVIAITSKIISICEGNVVPKTETDKQQLVEQHSDLYLSAKLSKYGHQFTITNNTLIPMAGVDESNGEGNYILWPRDAQKSANDIRTYLAEKYELKKIGVLITDSTCQPLRKGTLGIALAHSGFLALRNYIGKPDLFGRPFGVTEANISGGLAATAVLAMGEGAEQTPLCLISDLTSIDFQSRVPTPQELAQISISLEDDLFAQFLKAADWEKGNRSHPR